MIPIYIHLFLFITFIVIMLIKFGVPRSISEFYYFLENNKRGTGWLFTMWLFSIGITCLFYGNALLFTSGAFFIFTGAAARYRDKHTSLIHYIGASGGYILAILTISPWLIGLIIIGTIITTLQEIKNQTFWNQTGTFIIIIFGLIFKFYT